MAETYPVNVPDLVIEGSYTTTPIDTVLRFNNDTSKTMTRNMFTGELYNSTWRILMTLTEFQTFMLWYHTTLNKVLSFNFPEPSSGTLREYWFNVPPKVSHLGVDYVTVTFNVRHVVGHT